MKAIDRPARATCVHEAGHCIARFYFGFTTEEAVAIRGERRRRGRSAEEETRLAHTALGRTSGHPIDFPYRTEEMGFTDAADAAFHRERGLARAETALVVLAAGVLAEARHRRWGDGGIWVCGGGMGDMRDAMRIIERWLPRHAAPLDLACARARALLRAPASWAAVTAMADVLERHGRIDGDEIDEVCRTAFGGRRPAHDVWSGNWPPTLQQLREGSIPRHRETPREMPGLHSHCRSEPATA